jgi:hypothetical protein
MTDCGLQVSGVGFQVSKARKSEPDTRHLTPETREGPATREQWLTKDRKRQ